MKTEFEPFGPEWEKEIMKFSKPQLIKWIRDLLQKQNSIEEVAYENGYKDATKEACEEINKNYHPNDH